jgi:hypothetical protein
MRGCAMTMPRRWLVWLPVIMVASLLYWTVALGLGGMSLMAVSALSGSEGTGPLGLSASGGDTDTAPAATPRDGYEPIIVHLEESVEPEDVDDDPGCGRSASGGGGGSSEEASAAARGDEGGRDEMRAGVVSDYASGAAFR